MDRNCAHTHTHTYTHTHTHTNTHTHTQHNTHTHTSNELYYHMQIEAPGQMTKHAISTEDVNSSHLISSANLHSLVNLNDSCHGHVSPVVKGATDAKMVAVTSKVVPLVHVHAILLVGHNLNKNRQKTTTQTWTQPLKPCQLHLWYHPPHRERTCPSLSPCMATFPTGWESVSHTLLAMYRTCVHLKFLWDETFTVFADCMPCARILSK